MTEAMQSANQAHQARQGSGSRIQWARVICKLDGVVPEREGDKRFPRRQGARGGGARGKRVLEGPPDHTLLSIAPRGERGARGVHWTVAAGEGKGWRGLARWMWLSISIDRCESLLGVAGMLADKRFVLVLVPGDRAMRMQPSVVIRCTVTDGG